VAVLYSPASHAPRSRSTAGVLVDITYGPGWPSPGVLARGTSPFALAGADDDISRVLARVPTGRLIVLGQPGSGKTTLMVRLVLDLLAARGSASPVPVLVSLSSWHPLSQDFREWLAATLIIDYPGLAGVPPEGMVAPTSAAALLVSGLILPVLDGLDEIPGIARTAAIKRISEELRPGESVVLTSRSREYREAVEPQSGIPVLLYGATAIELRPLDADEVRNYLLASRGGERWLPVIDVVGNWKPVRDALSTPLMVSLANAIYNPQPGEPSAAARDPAELFDGTRFPDQTAVEAHLLAGYVDAVYGRYATDASRWLGFLAHHLRASDSDPDLVWRQLPRAAPRFLIPLVIAAVVSAGLAVVGTVVLETVGFRIWVTAGIVAAGGILTGSAAAAGLAGSGNYAVRLPGLQRLAWSRTSGHILPRTPRTTLARDRGAAIAAGMGAAALAAAVAGIVCAVIAGSGAGILAAAATGVFAGVAASFAEAVWPSYAIAHAWLAVRGLVPWRLMRFLDDACQRGVLRRAGSAYQLRYAGLERFLVTAQQPGVRQEATAASHVHASSEDSHIVHTWAESGGAAAGVVYGDVTRRESRPGEGSGPPSTNQSGLPGGGDGGRRGTDSSSAEPAPPQRYLRARLPDTVRPGQVFSVLVSVTRSGEVVLKPFGVPVGGRWLLFIIDSPRLRVVSERRQHVLVPADGDSEPVKFDLIADAPGPQRLSVTAWDGGSYLGELVAEVAIERDARGSADHAVTAEARGEWTDGEVSLLVRYDPRQSAYRFEFIDVDFPGEVTSQLLYDPAPAVERLVRGLNALAEDAAGYSAGETRDYLVNAGLQLWEELIPEKLRSQFWERQHRITQLTILTDHDVVPWELLYPKDPGYDGGFLVNQFPVTRAIFGRKRERRLQLHPARFVVPPDSPPEATTEAKTLAALLGTEFSAISDLTPLLRLIRTEPFGLLHFACHNRFDPADGTLIKLDRPFDPTFMRTAVSDQTLAACAPMVFINACRSAGQVPSYNKLNGWAESFMRAGAAAFIGTLWEVSDGAAREFAQELYRHLASGDPLGRAVMAARQAIAAAPGDPTWLAYAVYGDPKAKTIH